MAILEEVGDPARKYWIGLAKDEKDQVWKWSDGSTLQLSHWEEGQPSSDEWHDYAVMRMGYKYYNSLYQINPTGFF